MPTRRLLARCGREPRGVHQTVVCVTLGTGVGGGIILDVSYGAAWMAQRQRSAHVCRPFRRRCLFVWQPWLSRSLRFSHAIVRMANERLPRYPNSMLRAEGELNRKNLPCWSRRGPARAGSFRIMGVYLGIGLSNLINILNPEMIVIGGGSSTADAV